MTISRSREAAFTLIELLMVVMLITVLFGILLSAVRTVQRHTLQTVTQGELKNLENAWKQYFAHYQAWPDTSAAGGSPVCLINDVIAEALQGITNNSSNLWAKEWNPDGIVFMEFARFDSGGIPLNPWGESGRHPKEACAYYVLFDNDGDNQLQEADLAAFPLPRPFTNTLARSVAVWTYNPEIKDRITKDPLVIGSWKQ